jgi:phosphotriesterase-related protein
MTFHKPIMLPVFLSLAIFSCQPVESDLRVMTVNGSMFASDMEITLSHEHVMVDWIGADSTGYHRWNRAEVVERVLPYFLEAREKGIHTIVEFTPAYLGRDPFILKELSQRSGIWAITNTGYYGAVDNNFMPAHASEESAGEIAGRWIDEFVNGIDGSGLKPGFMKISVAGNRPLSELHQKIVQAAAITHLETGMTIASHTIGDEPAFAQIELLKNEGVSPSAWIWTHAQSGSLEANIQTASEGAWIALDGVKHDPGHEPGETGSIEWYVNRIMELRYAGFLERILISHDAGWYDVGEPDGGNYRRYTDIVDYLVPELLENGFRESEIRQLMEINPQQAFGIRVRSVK